MGTKLDIRQSISHDVLDQIAAVTEKQVDALLRSINSELIMPLRMKASSPSDLVLNINNASIANPETNRKRTVSHIADSYTSFVSGTVTFPAATGGNITFSTGGSTPVLLTCPIGQFVKVLIYLDESGNLGAIVGADAASESAAVVPAPEVRTYSIGFVTVWNNAGTMSNIASTNIYQFVGSSGGSGMSVVAIDHTPITLKKGVTYIIDLSGASGNVTYTLPLATKGSDIKCLVIGNLNNGYNAIFNTSGSQNIYDNTGTTATSYQLYNLESVIEFAWENAPTARWIASLGGAGGGSGSGSPLDPNPESRFVYYTRSDFAVDKKKFANTLTGAVITGTDNILGLGKIILATDQYVQSNDLRGPVFTTDNPYVNQMQLITLYKTGLVDVSGFKFTVTAANATVGAIYADVNGKQYTVLATISSGTTLRCSGNGTNVSSGTLTLVSGTGDATITFSAVAANMQVSIDNGSTWLNPYLTTSSNDQIIADFTFSTPAQVSSGMKIKISGAKATSVELIGFGVESVLDQPGTYAGDFNFELRTITPTEASTGLISLANVKFTPGAGQLHCNYNGHDYTTPTFVEVGGGAVQFAINFFNAGDVVKFWVSYGLVNLDNSPITINNMLSSNSTLGNVSIPSGFTLDKPWMEIPAGAIVSGAGNVETAGVISGLGILATTGTILSTGISPTQPKFDRIEEATPTKGVSVQGKTDGSSIPAGYVGEVISANVVGAADNTNTYKDVTGASLTLTPGVWMIMGALPTYMSIYGVATGVGTVALTDASNTVIDGYELESMRVTAPVGGVYGESTQVLSILLIKTIASTATYKLRMKGNSGTYYIQTPSRFYAVRIG